MNNQQRGQGDSGEVRGYDTPGQDTIIESTSSAVPSPSRTTEERLPSHKPVLESINETPGDANPAVVETVGAEKGQVSTADMLRVREAAEEQHLREASDVAYQDQGPGSQPSEFEQSDTGRPNWPHDRQQAPVEYMESPRGDAPLLAGAPEVMAPAMKPRLDWAADRAGTQAAAQESRSGLAPTGVDAEEDIYERREMHKPTEQPDLDRIVPGMVNLPPEDNDGDA